MKTKNTLRCYRWSPVFSIVVCTSVFIFFNSICTAQSRDEMLQPEKVMDIIGIKSGMIIGEVGAGEGYFTYKIAKRVGSSGYVYANDIREDDLQSIQKKCNTENITNILTILGKVEDPMFPSNKMDMVFMSYVFHMLEKPKDLLMNIIPSLKKGATLVILDIDPERMLRGPYPENSKIAEIAENAGFILLSKIDYAEGVDINIFQLRK